MGICFKWHSCSTAYHPFIRIYVPKALASPDTWMSLCGWLAIPHRNISWGWGAGSFAQDCVPTSDSQCRLGCGEEGAPLVGEVPWSSQCKTHVRYDVVIGKLRACCWVWIGWFGAFNSWRRWSSVEGRGTCTRALLPTGSELENSSAGSWLSWLSRELAGNWQGGEECGADQLGDLNCLFSGYDFSWAQMLIFIWSHLDGVTGLHPVGWAPEVFVGLVSGLK